MKISVILSLAAATVLIPAALAQSPTTPKPKGTAPRGISGGGSFDPAGIAVVPQKEAKTIRKTVTYMALTKKRQWLSADGKSIIATLVAFDVGDEAGFVPPTVIKEEKIRLLRDNKEFVLPLGRLSAAHQDDVLAIDDKVKSSYAAMKKAAGAQRDAAEGP